MRIQSPATCARPGATAANATAPGRSRPPRKGGASPRPADASATSCANTNRPPKKELAYRNHCTTIEQLRRDLNDYVWRSDDQRLHSTPAQTPEEPFFSISMSHAVDYTLAVPSSITNRCRAAMDTSDLTAVTLLYIESSFWYFPTSFSKVSGIWHSAPGWDAR